VNQSWQTTPSGVSHTFSEVEVDSTNLTKKLVRKIYPNDTIILSSKVLSNLVDWTRTPFRNHVVNFCTISACCESMIFKRRLMKPCVVAVVRRRVWRTLTLTTGGNNTWRGLEPTNWNTWISFVGSTEKERDLLLGSSSLKLFSHLVRQLQC